METVAFQDHGNGIFSVQCTGKDSRNTLSPEMLTQLVTALDTARHAVALKALIIKGTPGAFLAGGEAQYNEALSQGLFASIASFPCPVIAAMQGDASGAGFLAGALCDFMVCSQSGVYRYTDAGEDFFPTAEADALFRERFGRARATDFLYRASACTGRQLQEKRWSCPIVPSEQVETRAHALAANLARKSQSSLRLLKAHLARDIRELVRRLTASAPVKPLVRSLSPAGAPVAAQSQHIGLANGGDGVLLVKIRGTPSAEAITVVADLSELFEQLNSAAAAGNARFGAVVLMSERDDFLPGAAAHRSAEGVLRLRRVLRQSSLPTIAVLPARSSGLAWLIGELCDAAVYSREAQYSAADLLRSPALAEIAGEIFAYRFGGPAGRDIALAGAGFAGVELEQRLGPVLVASQDQALAEALKLAQRWAGFPLSTVAAWRKYGAPSIAEDGIEIQVRGFAETVATGSCTELISSEPDAGTVRAPTRIALESQVITATAHAGGILVVSLEDRQSKNLFSHDFVRGLQEVFRHIATTATYKVAVLTGYENYFACGGTREALLAIQEGRAKFTDDKTYQATLTCEIPVIAVMQGHGIGGGLSLGLFSDFVLLSEESQYVSPYMGYGFTPGAGATLIVPEKLGHDLARETLLTAQEYAGSELRDRGAPLPVYPRKQIHAAGMALAELIARHPRDSLIRLKQGLNRSIHERLEHSTRLEIAMHERTFVGQADTLKQIQTSFNPMDDTTTAKPVSHASRNSLSGAQALREIVAGLKQLLAQELHMKLEDVDEDTQFIDLGLDSITGVTWVRKINERYATAIQATKVYSFPTLNKLGLYVRDEAQRTSASASPPRAESSIAAAPIASTPAIPAIAQSHASGAAPPTRKERPKLASWRDQRAPKVSAIKVPGDAPRAIAVIGMAGQFPKSKTLEDYWENIAQGRNCISEIPPGRWDIDAYYGPEGGVPGKTNSKWMGLLEEYDRFDPQFFEISPKEALSMDPQQRVFLQACWHAIEHAGYNPKALSAGKCGVFAGCGPGDYRLLSRDLQISALGFTGGDTSILAARVSYFLDLKGPCLSIETACSSSLVAIATACDNLVSGNCDLALAGGVYVMTGPELHIKTAQMGMLSPDGRCYTFDQRANGFVPGEGVGAVLLKRLADAERDGDIILGVIQGWGVNQDGKTNGITAPNPESQARLQQEVYDKYQIDPAGIQLIEAHGTGTKLGDPIEIDALKQSFRKYTPLKGYCALGSVKSNIGHCFTAAGVAGTIKVLLALQHKQLPPTINFERLNEHIDLDDSPFHVNDRLQSWEPRGAQRRQAAISGFGFGGTNAHIVVAEYSAPVSARPQVPALRTNGQVIVALSARTAEQLNQKALDLLELVENRGRSADLSSIAYTLQVGREPMDARLAFLAGSIDELKTKLGACARGDCDSQGICRGRVSDSKEALSFIRRDDDVREGIVDRLIGQRKLSSLLELWVKGLAFDWNRLYGNTRPARIHLPVYPFAKERYWIDSVAAPRGSRAARLTSALHPVLHTNTSNLQEYSFRSTFRGDEAFLEDAGIDGGKVLSAVACLEMARAAVAQVWPANEAVVVELRDVVWGEPFRVSRDQDIAIALYANEDETIEFEIHSKADGAEVVHCRGRAASSPESVSPRLDLARIEDEALLAGADALPRRFSLPRSDQASEDYVLHPRLLDLVLKGSFSPSALRQVRVMARCPQEGVARVRHSVTATEGDQIASVDVDFCDRYGNVCVEIRGLSLQPAGEDSGRETQELPISTGVEPNSARPGDVVEAGVSRAQLIQALKASLAQALYLKTCDISVDRPFIELGLDSIVGVEWVGELNKAYDLKITATKLYDYPNITELAAYVEKELQKSFVPTVPQHAAPVVESRTAAAKRSYPSLKRRARTGRRAIARGAAPAVDKIAVIGMSGRYPQAKNLEQFWDNLLRGRDSISEVPPSRWDVKRYYDPDTTRQDTVYCKWLGVLDEVDCFDPLFFKISPAEAKGMDPQHRLFLEESYKAFEDAGYATKALSHKKCGVYLGMIGNEYGSLVARSGSASVDLTGNNPAIGAARVAYFLNLKGPAISIDTACSSSLVAIHLACQGLLNHETDMALAGGVTVYLEPQSYFGMCQAGMLSPDGRCKTFDDSANGFVPGEGVGVVVLKRLQDALRDNDRIHGVILGSGINQDGKTNGITAPSVNSQIELGRELYARHGIDPETISYVEAHGTGTKLGDPIELEALATVFKEKTSKLSYCALGSVKSNIGHTSGAAGVAGVQKVLLCMQHRMLVPTLNVTKENALFDFASSPFYVSKEKRPWDTSEGSPRRAGVSSFGFSGTNAHLVLEEYAPPVAHRRPAALESAAPQVLIPLSARTPEQLRQKAVDLLQFLRSSDPSKREDLLSIAYTLFTGRDAMDERLGLVVRTVAELTEKLQVYVRGEARVAGICEGKVERDSEGAMVVRPEEPPTQDLHKLLELWVRGLDLDWHALHSGATPPRAALPTYPFARKRCWVDVKAEHPAPTAGTEATALHPLLHRNISVLGQQGYCSTFSGDELFLVEHRTDAGALHKVLPAVAYLEMARMAVEQAMPNRLEGISAQLRSIAWGRPLVAAKHRQVNIALFKRNEAQVDFEIYSLNQESQSPAEEIVHCQGHATLLRKSEFARLDLERLKTQRGNGQHLAQLSLPASARTNWGAYVLHPSVLDTALQAAAEILDHSSHRPKNFSLPFALDALHLEAACPAEGFAWIRFAAGSSSQDKIVKLDIDLCDRSGKVCVALRGMAYEQETSVSSPAPERTAQERPIRVLLPASGERSLGSAPKQVPLVTLDAPTQASRAR